ncbi:MAG: S26 family signal peptidase [Thermoplasmatota archaeon]
MMNIEQLKRLFLKFWKSEDEKISFVRDILVAVFVVVLILSALWTYTGQWFGAPMVAIESGSMMHLNEPFGRLGSIDAGDMVLLVKVDSFDDIVTKGSEEKKGSSGFSSYGDYGDVIVYRKYGLMDAEQIIHRSMCWIEMNSDGTYMVEAYGLENVSSITLPELGLSKYKPTHSGYITKGDNPVTNDRCDQAGGICSEPIQLDWVTGKARGEIPWVGTLNLLFNDIISGSFWSGHDAPTVYNVPGDSMICLVILIVVLISIPVSLDVYEYVKKRKKSDNV